MGVLVIGNWIKRTPDSTADEGYDSENGKSFDTLIRALIRVSQALLTRLQILHLIDDFLQRQLDSPQFSFHGL